MRSIRFSDQVLADSYEDDEQEDDNNLQMRNLRPKRASAFKAPPSIAASDTSSAAGFSRTRRPFHATTAAIARTYADPQQQPPPPPNNPGFNNALYPRSTQEFLDEYEYRGFDQASSVTTGSPYSPRSGDSSSYNYSNGTAVKNAVSILKNSGATLPRPHSRASLAYANTNGNALNRGRVHSMDFSNRPLMMEQQQLHYNNRPPSSLRGGYGNNGGTNWTSQNMNERNGSVVSSCSSSAVSSRFRAMNNNVNNNLNGGGRYFSDVANTRIIPNPMDNNNPADRPPPPTTTTTPQPPQPAPLMPKRATSTQIIATRTVKPLCGDCACIQRVRGGELDESGQPQSTPIGVLFTIFLVFSFVVVSGVMLYLRGGLFFIRVFTPFPFRPTYQLFT